MKVSLLGVSIDKVTFNEAVEEITHLLNSGSVRHFIATPNPEFLIYAQKDASFREILNRADLAIPDGVGILWASKMLKLGIPERIAGVDLAEKAIEVASSHGVPVFFLGGRGNVAERASTQLKKIYPRLHIAGAVAGNPGQESDGEITEFINRSQAGLVLVAYGHPKQEYWMERNLPRLNVKLTIGVGGAFDFWSGDLPRAPKLVQKLGLEWLFRLIRQPWRAKRQLSLLHFMALVLSSKWSKKGRTPAGSGGS